MLSFQRSTSDNPDFHQLIKKLDKELWERYDALQALYDKHNKIEKIDTVVVAYFENAAIGCGCFKYHDQSTSEIKRMYVLPSHLGKGIAQRIVEELCTWAKECGFRIVILETGKKQPEAIRLYEKAGFVKTPNYEPYVGMEQSVCMAREL